MRASILGLVLATMAFGSAAAQVAPSGEKPTINRAEKDQVQPQTRSVYICDASRLTRRSFAREHGQVEFVGAKDLMDTTSSWNSPKCIRESDLAKFKRMQVASVRQ